MKVFAKNTKQKNKIAKTINELYETKAGKEVLLAAKENKTKIIVDKSSGLSGEYDGNKNVLSVSPDKDETDLFLILAHELRHAQKKHEEKPVEPDHFLDVKSLTMSIRAMEADAYCFEALCAYENKNSWERTKENIPDIASAIEKEKKKNKGDNTKAMEAGFKAFFDNPYLLEAYEHKAISFTRNVVQSNFDNLSNPNVYSQEKNSSEIIKNICSIGGKEYIKPESKLIENEKYIKTSDYFNDFYKSFFEKRQKETGIKKDPSFVAMINKKNPNITLINRAKVR